MPEIWNMPEVWRQAPKFDLKDQNGARILMSSGVWVDSYGHYHSMDCVNYEWLCKEGTIGSLVRLNPGITNGEQEVAES
jgi:hypothetical protein